MDLGPAVGLCRVSTEETGGSTGTDENKELHTTGRNPNFRVFRVDFNPIPTKSVGRSSTTTGLQIDLPCRGPTPDLREDGIMVKSPGTVLRRFRRTFEDLYQNSK